MAAGDRKPPRAVAWGPVVGLLALLACRGTDELSSAGGAPGAPEDAPLTARRPAGSSGTVAGPPRVAAPAAPPEQAPPASLPSQELLWGGWHRVPVDPDAALVLHAAWALAEEGLSEEALETLHVGLARHPDAPSLHEARGALYLALGYARPAERDFDLATRLRPERGATWYALGRARGELELPRAALVALGEARRLGVEDPKLDLLCARALRRLGYRGEAAARYAHALASSEDVAFEFFLEAGSLSFVPEEVSRRSWTEARELLLADSDPDRERLARSLLESWDALQDPSEALRRSGLTADELRAWTRVALVAVGLDDPGPAGERVAAELRQRR